MASGCPCAASQSKRVPAQSLAPMAGEGRFRKGGMGREVEGSCQRQKAEHRGADHEAEATSACSAQAVLVGEF